ncbi:MAG: ribosome biogenesis GTPase Der [Chlamydiales bacterium]
MSRLLRLAIVGRPNVGKSALFNAICGKKIAIVDSQEGVTRDRIYAEADFFGQKFEVIDTAGLDSGSKIPFQEEVRRQTEIAIQEADVIVMLVDSRAGVTVADEQVAKLLLKTKTPVCLAVNKIDNLQEVHALHQFHSLGIPRMIAISAIQRFQIAELLELAFEDVEFPAGDGEASGIKVAIVGRPNVVKSTLMNALLKEERCVVSPIPGTTRDSVDTRIAIDDTVFTLIDTAGIRRKTAEHEAIEKFSAIRTERAIERADVAVLMLESMEGITTQEKRIVTELEGGGKGCLLLFNKWDLVQGCRMEHCLKSLQIETSFVSHCPTLFASAKTGRNIDKIFTNVKQIYQDRKRRIPTGELNRFIEKATQAYHPPMLQGRRLRIYYLAQVGIEPPHFVLFVNKPELMLETYKQYLINQFREAYGFQGVPIVFTLRGKQSREDDKPAPAPSHATHVETSDEPEEVLV